MARSALATLAFAAAAGSAQAHAFGERYDLPLPLWLNLVGGAAAVILSFVIAAWFVRPAPAEGRACCTNLLAIPAAPPIACAIVLFSARAGSVFLFVLALAAGFFGEPDYARNAAPTIMWVLGWVGLAFVSALIGNVWLVLNPWRSLFAGANVVLGAVSGSRGLSLDLRLPQKLGVWPGIVLVMGFVWFMLASGRAGDSLAIAQMLALYSVVTWAGMALFGPAAWLARGEAFTLIFGVLARFSPAELRVTDREICARAGGPPDAAGACSDCIEAFLRAPRGARAVYLRPYGAGLVVAHPLPQSVTVLVLMVLALVGFEGFMDTAQWIDLMVALGERPDAIQAPVKTALLFMLATALLYAVFYGVSALMRRVGAAHTAPGARTRTTGEIMGLFVLSLVPIALAYHVAHYLYWFFTSIQFVVPAASDPLGFGWNLFGGRNFVPDRAAISLKVIWHTAVVAIVLGHVIAVYAAHRQALLVFGSRRAALWSQLPMLTLMVAYTMSSLWMLAQPIMG